jgi:hypothetical protein
VQGLLLALRIDDAKDTVDSIVFELLNESKISSQEIPHLVQCYLAMVPAVIGPEALDYRVEVLPELFFDFRTYVERFYKTLKKAGIEEPLLFANPERTYNNLYMMSGVWKNKKKYKFEPSPHNSQQLAAIVRNAKDENEFVGLFYKYVISPALRIE